MASELLLQIWVDADLTELRVSNIRAAEAGIVLA